jgi:hypothetical protein
MYLYILHGGEEEEEEDDLFFFYFFIFMVLVKYKLVSKRQCLREMRCLHLHHGETYYLYLEAHLRGPPEYNVKH